MILLIDVLGPWAHLGTLGKLNGTSIILKHSAFDGSAGVRQRNLVISHLLNKSNEGDDFTKGLRHGHILCLCSRQGDLSLQLGGPVEGAVGIK